MVFNLVLLRNEYIKQELLEHLDILSSIFPKNKAESSDLLDD